MSLLSKALVLSYFIYLLKQVIGRDQYTVMSSLRKQSDANAQSLILNESNFDLGVSLDCFECGKALGS